MKQNQRKENIEKAKNEIIGVLKRYKLTIFESDGLLKDLKDGSTKAIVELIESGVLKVVNEDDN